MTRLKDATFESGSLTGTDGFTSTTGSPTLDTTSKVRGINSARTNWLSATNMNGTVSGMNNGELFISFYLLIGALPSSGSPRIITLSNANTQLNFTLSSTGTLAARQNTTALGSLATGLTTNTAYRIGIHAKVSTALANADGIYDLYIATGDAAFGSAVISSSTITMNTSAGNYTNIVLGMNNGVAATADIYWDSLRIDDTSMPAPDGGTNTPKAISLSITETIIYQNNTGKPISYAITSTPLIIKSILKPILRTVATAVSIIKIVSKPITRAITSAVSTIKNVAKPITRSITSTISAVVARAYFKALSITVVSSSLIQKNIVKPLLYTVTTTKAITKLFTLSISYGISSVVSMVKTLHNQLTFASMKTNARVLLINLKDSASNILNKNQSTIRYQDIDQS